MTLQRVSRKKMGEILVEFEKLSKDQLKQALDIQKEKGGAIGEILIAQGFVTEDEIVSCLAIQYGLPFLSLQNYDFDEKIFSLVPEEMILDHMCIPLDQMGKVLTVAMTNPLEEGLVDKIEKLTGLKVQCFICSLSDLKQIIEKYFSKK